MINVKIDAFGTLSSILTKKIISIDDNTTVYELLQYIDRNTEKDFLNAILDGNCLKSYTFIFVNGENTIHKEGLNTKINDGDNITILRGDLAGG